VVLTHSRALLASRPEGRTAYIHADLRQPEGILSHRVTREVLDFTQPVALMLLAILHLIPDEDKSAEIVATLLDTLPPAATLSRRTAHRNMTRPRRRTWRVPSVSPGFRFTCVTQVTSPGWRFPA
jgi:hypothetical protein